MWANVCESLTQTLVSVQFKWTTFIIDDLAHFLCSNTKYFFLIYIAINETSFDCYVGLNNGLAVLYVPCNALHRLFVYAKSKYLKITNTIWSSSILYLNSRCTKIVRNLYINIHITKKWKVWKEWIYIKQEEYDI